MHHLVLGKEFLRKGQSCNFRQRSHEKFSVFSVYLLKFKLSQLRKWKICRGCCRMIPQDCTSVKKRSIGHTIKFKDVPFELIR